MGFHLGCSKIGEGELAALAEPESELAELSRVIRDGVDGAPLFPVTVSAYAFRCAGRQRYERIGSPVLAGIIFDEFKGCRFETSGAILSKAPLQKEPAFIERPFVPSKAQPERPGAKRSGESEKEQQRKNEVRALAVRGEKVHGNQ